MAKALVLGATGHIGAHVTQALLAEGHTVRAAYRNEKYLRLLDGLPVERVRVDLERPQDLRPALAGCDWVFHAAGYYPPSLENRARAIERGIRSARQVLEEIGRARPKRVVFTSSAATIHGVEGRPANEEDAEPWPLKHWRHLYATVKIAMEHVALESAQAGLPVVIVNPTLCIGEYDAHAFSGRAVLAFAKYRVPWVTETVINVVYTGDVGVGQVRAAEKGRVGGRYLLAGRNLTLREFAGLAAKEAGVPPPRWRVPYWTAWMSACVVEAAAWLTRRDPLFTRQEAHRVRRGYSLDGSKAVRELGMPQTSMEEAVHRALKWFKKEGMA